VSLLSAKEKSRSARWWSNPSELTPRLNQGAPTGAPCHLPQNGVLSREAANDAKNFRTRSFWQTGKNFWAVGWQRLSVANLQGIKMFL